MNDRDRYNQTLTFGNPDRIFYNFGGPRASTLYAWQKQGLPKEINSGDAFKTFVGSDKIDYIDCVNVGPMPEFEGRLTEEKDDRTTMRMVIY